MTTPKGEFTQSLETALARLNAGDPGALDDLLKHTSERLINLTRHIKREFPGVGRWEQTDDVFQNASLRLYRALQSVKINDADHFLSLAAQHIRWELIDLAKKYAGPLGLGNHHATRGLAQPPTQADTNAGDVILDAAEVTQDPQSLAQWTEFHQAVEKLPEAERQIFDLLWYHGLKQEEAAEILEIDVRTIKRRWRAARLALHERLGDFPDL